MSDIKSQCVDLLLSRECDGGGWALGLGAAEADITAMAITALAPYKKAAAAIERGVEKLSALQNANGSFSSGGVETSESCSQVLVALSTVGINAHKDSRFIKNGNSALDALCAFYVGGGLHTWQTAAQIQWQPNRLHMHFARTTDFFPGKARFTT